MSTQIRAVNVCDRYMKSVRLISALGVYDGRVYDAFWERAQTEPLNQSPVPDGYKVGR